MLQFIITYQSSTNYIAGNGDARSPLKMGKNTSGVFSIDSLSFHYWHIVSPG